MHIYRDILKRSWHILWRHPWLWLLGLFAALMGNGGVYSSLVSNMDKVTNEAAFLSYIKYNLVSNPWANLTGQFNNVFAQASPMDILGLAAVFVVGLLIFWFAVVSQAGLILSAGQLDEEKPIGLRSAVRESKKFFGPIFFLNIISKFATYLLLTVALLPFLIAFLTQSTAGFSFDALIIISFIVLVPLASIISFIIKYASIYVVRQGEHWWIALEKAVSLFFKNWLTSLEMAAVLFGINLVLSWLLIMLILPDAVSIQRDIVTSIALQSYNLILIGRLLFMFLVFLATGAWLATYEFTAWTLLFDAINRGEVKPKLTRLAENFRRK